MPTQPSPPAQEHTCYVCGDPVKPTRDCPYEQQAIGSCEVILDSQGHTVKMGDWNWVAHKRCLK